MQKGVFYNWLEGQFGDRQAAKLWGNVCYKVGTVIVTHILKLHIKRYMGNFIINGTEKLFLSKRQTVKAGESLNCLAYLADLARFCLLYTSRCV